MRNVTTPASIMISARAFAQQARRSRWLPVTILLVLVAASFFAGRLTAPGLPDTQGPPKLTLPPHASLVRWEEYPSDHEAIWYYAVPASSHAAVMSFFKGQMTQGSWSCFTSDLTHAITRNGQSFTGSNGYVAARNGSLDVQINTGDQSFGAFLLQYDLDQGAIAVKIDVSTSDTSGCGGK